MRSAAAEDANYNDNFLMISCLPAACWFLMEHAQCERSSVLCRCSVTLSGAAIRRSSIQTAMWTPAVVRPHVLNNVVVSDLSSLNPRSGQRLPCRPCSNACTHHACMSDVSTALQMPALTSRSEAF